MPSGYSNALYEIDEMNPFGLKKYKERVNYAKNTTLPGLKGKIVETGNSKSIRTLEGTVSIKRSRYEIESDNSLGGFLTYKWSVSGATIISGGTASHKYVEVETSAESDSTFTILCTISDQKKILELSESYTHKREFVPTPINISSLVETVPGSCSFAEGNTCVATSTYTVAASGHQPLSYNWTVVGGIITSGQGTEEITVETTGDTNAPLNVKCDVSNEYENVDISNNYVHTRSVIPYVYNQTIVFNNTNIQSEFATFV